MSIESNIQTQVGNVNGSGNTSEKITTVENVTFVKTIVIDYVSEFNDQHISIYSKELGINEFFYLGSSGKYPTQKILTINKLLATDVEIEFDA